MTLVGRLGHARVVVLTVIDEELAAVRLEFGASHRHGRYYLQQPSTADRSEVAVAIVQLVARTNTVAGLDVGFVLGDWRPEFLILCGVAGGVCRTRETDDGQVVLEQEAAVGDVVVGTYVHLAGYYKAVGGRERYRYMPLTQPSPRLVSEHCRPVSGDAWFDDSLSVHRPDGGRARVHFGEVVVDDSIASDGGNAHHTAVLTHFDKAIAFEMESGGIAQGFVMHDSDVHYNPRWICVRGISDPVAVGAQAAELLPATGEDIRQRWKAGAARIAAAYAHAVTADLLADERPPMTARPSGAAYVRPAAAIDASRAQPARSADPPDTDLSDPTTTMAS